MRLHLDAGALIAVERRDPAMLARLLVAQRRAVPVVTSVLALAEVWRDGARQANPARELDGFDQRSVDPDAARSIGVLLARSGTADVVDAHVTLPAAGADIALTSDAGDIGHLLRCLDSAASVVAV